MFKAKKQTNRFRKNQRVWILKHHGTHAEIVFKYRGCGRYVKGLLSTEFFSINQEKNSVIGLNGVKSISIDDDFYFKLKRHID